MRASESKLRALAQQRDVEQREAQLETWIHTLPFKYRGRSEQDILDGWGGQLKGPELASIRRILKRTKRGGFVLLQGPSGTGKTTLACTVATELVRNHHLSAMFTSAISMFQEFSYSGADRPIDQFSNPDVLIIDDLGAVNEGMTSHQHRLLWAVIENRWSHASKLTIITSNMAINDNEDGAGLKTLIGQSGWDRISDDLEYLMLAGESFRGIEV